MYILYNYKSNFYSKTQYLKVSWVADSFKYFMVSGLNDIQYNVTVVVLRFLQAQILVKTVKSHGKKHRENCKMI